MHSRSRASRRSSIGYRPLFALLSGVLSASCTTDCASGDNLPPREYREGATEGGVYTSSPVAGPYLVFPAGVSWELFHDLGSVPGSWRANLAFDECPTAQPCGSVDGAGTGVTQAAGNMASLVSLTAESVVLKNDTCADFFLHVVLSDPSPQ